MKLLEHNFFRIQAAPGIPLISCDILTVYMDEILIDVFHSINEH